MKMPNVRPLNNKKYNISKHKFMEVYHHCLQYQEWQDELKYKTDAVKSIEYGNEVHGSGPSGSSTERIAMRRAELAKKCELIEQTVLETDKDLYQYLLKAVTTEYVTYKYLKEIMGMPAGKDMYYDRRKKFYYLMSKKI